MESGTKYIFSSISEYGPYTVVLGVILAIFIYIIYTNNKNQKKMQDEIMKSSESYKKALMDTTQKMIEQLIEDKNGKNKGVDLMATFNKLRDSLQGYCRDTLNSIKADRLAIYLFHNGTHSTHGINFFKVSCMCENVRIGSGIVEHSIDHNNVPLNLFDDMINELINSGEYVILNNKELKDKNYRIFISADKITFAVTMAIFDPNNIILGFVLSEFSIPIENADMENIKKKLKTLIIQVSPILSYSDYVDTNMQMKRYGN